MTSSATSGGPSSRPPSQPSNRAAPGSSTLSENRGVAPHRPRLKGAGRREHSHSPLPATRPRNSGRGKFGRRPIHRFHLSGPAQGRGRRDGRASRLPIPALRRRVGRYSVRFDAVPGQHPHQRRVVHRDHRLWAAICFDVGPVPRHRGAGRLRAQLCQHVGVRGACAAAAAHGGAAGQSRESCQRCLLARCRGRLARERRASVRVRTRGHSSSGFPTGRTAQSFHFIAAGPR